MKKILTLAVALVMVFALAAPALAAGWDNPVTPDEFEDLYLNITPLSVEESTIVWYGGTYNKLDKTYPVVAGMKVHAFVEVKVPAYDDLSKDIQDRLAAGQGKLKISTSNLEDVTAQWKYSTETSYTHTALISGNKTSGTLAISKKSCDKTIYVEIWGTAEKSDKDAKITATLGVYNEWDASETQFDFFSNGTKYTISKNATDADYTVYKTSDRTAGVRFYTKSSGQVENIYVVLDSQVYAIHDYMGGNPSFVPVGGTRPITGDDLRDVKAVLDDICGAMGFEYAGDAYITDPLVEKNLGTIVEGSASLVYPSGYFQEIVTNDPGVNPPQTGDSASIAGFVMIAVALVAAAAVTVKKVRA